MEHKQVTVTVSLGRNIGNNPMTSAQWQRFTRLAKLAVAQHSLATHYVGVGSGIYDGMREESLTVVATVRVQRLKSLRDALRTLAVRFSQDSIALTVGTTEFLSA